MLVTPPPLLLPLIGGLQDWKIRYCEGLGLVREGGGLRRQITHLKWTLEGFLLLLGRAGRKEPGREEMPGLAWLSR